jgi:hypothetical protein
LIRFAGTVGKVERGSGVGHKYPRKRRFPASVARGRALKGA